MASLLNMMPIGAAWLQWNSDKTGSLILDLLTQDVTHTLISGEDGTGKTCLAFQTAVSVATDNKQVMFIRPKELSQLPLPVHGMPTPESATLQLVKFWYPENAEEVVKWCGHIHTLVLLPDVIVIDDFDVFCGQNKSAEYDAARLLASLVDAAAWVAQKSGYCKLLLTASQRIPTLPSVSHQFRISVFKLTEVRNEKGMYQLTCATDNQRLLLHYSITHQHIMLRSVDCKQMRFLDTSLPQSPTV